MSPPDVSGKGRRYDDRRASSAQRGYGSKWQKARLLFLAEHPLCCRCQEQGQIVPATVVDHIKAHKGDSKLFWDRKNWQPLCDPHHNRDKQREERLGYRQGSDANGWPIDQGHHWNTR